ncbi:unnamed protein product, partial [marine sediment metagenome]
MRWFQHQTNASDDIKLKRLEEEFSNDGYATFFKLLEKIGKEGKNYRLSLEKYPIDLLAKDFHIALERFEKILKKIKEIKLLEVNVKNIYAPKMKKYADEYTQRGRKYYEIRKYPKEDY